MSVYLHICFPVIKTLGPPPLHISLLVYMPVFILVLYDLEEPWIKPGVKSIAKSSGLASHAISMLCWTAPGLF